MITSGNCKSLLVNLFTANKGLQTYFDLSGQDLKKVLSTASWKRLFKCNSVEGHDTGYMELPGRYMLFEPNSLINRFGETSMFEPCTNFKIVRGFDCAPTEGAIRYLVLERHDGTIVVGDYFGD